MRRRLLGAALALVLLLVGGVIALAAVALHLWWWGLVLGGAATLLAAIAVPAGWATRLPYTVGWWLVAVRAMVPRHTGAFWVQGDGPGYGVVGIGLALIVATTATLPLRGLRGRRPSAGSG